MKLKLTEIPYCWLIAAPPAGEGGSIDGRYRESVRPRRGRATAEDRDWLLHEERKKEPNQNDIFPNSDCLSTAEG